MIARLYSRTCRDRKLVPPLVWRIDLEENDVRAQRYDDHGAVPTLLQEIFEK